MLTWTLLPLRAALLMLTLGSEAASVQPNCRDVRGTCLYKASGLRCGLIMEALCTTPAEYCCNMTASFITSSEQNELNIEEYPHQSSKHHERNMEEYPHQAHRHHERNIEKYPHQATEHHERNMEEHPHKAHEHHESNIEEYPHQAPPTCQTLKGGKCVAEASGIHCPKTINGSCSRIDNICCNMTAPDTPHCGSMDGTCLSNKSYIICPSKLDAFCTEASYCCNMTILPPNPLPSCSQLNGSCLFKYSHIHCPSKRNASCPLEDNYCCDMSPLPPPSNRPTCAERQGECVGDSWPYFCPSRVNASCDPGYYCCGYGDSLPLSRQDQTKLGKFAEKPQLLQIKEIPPCSDFDASCIGDTWPYYCPPTMRLNASCPQMFYCCGNNDSLSFKQPADKIIYKVTDNVTPPTCYDQNGHCLHNKSDVYCPASSKLNGSCPNSYYCCSNLPAPPACVSEMHGRCLSNASAIHCLSVLNGACSDSRHYCCNMTTLHTPFPEEEKMLILSGVEDPKPVMSKEEEPGRELSEEEELSQELPEEEEEETIKELPFPGMLNTLLFKTHYKMSPKQFNDIPPEEDILVFTEEAFSPQLEYVPLIPSCESIVGAQCLQNNSRIYCPEKLGAACEFYDTYCCKLQ